MSTQVLQVADAPAAVSATSAGWRRFPRSGWFWAALAAALLLIWWVDLPYLRQYLDRDEGAFFVMAQGLLHGRVPYRDAFDQKPPGIYFLLAPVLAVTSPFSVTAQVVAARLLVLAANLATAAGLVALGARWRSLETGVLAAGLWLFALPLFGGSLALTEPFAVTCTVWAFVLAGRCADFRTALGTGALVGIGALFKQTAVLALPGVGLVLLAGALRSEVPWRERGWGGAWRSGWPVAAGLAVGAAAPWVVTGAYFAINGALGPFFQDVLIANLHYPADPASVTLGYLKAEFFTIPLIMVLPVVLSVFGAGAWALRRARGRRPAVNVGLVAALLTALLNLAPFVSHAYSHYWLQVFPWSCLLSGVAIMWAIDRARAAPDGAGTGAWVGASRPFDAPLRAALLPLIVVLVLAFGAANWDRPTVTDRFYQQKRAGDWIRNTVPANARLLVGQAEPEYYFLSGHAPVTSYLYVLPINATPAVVGQVRAQLDAHAFDYVVWETNPGLPYDGLDLWQYVSQRYHVIGRDDEVGLLLLAPDA